MNKLTKLTCEKLGLPEVVAELFLSAGWQPSVENLRKWTQEGNVVVEFYNGEKSHFYKNDTIEVSEIAYLMKKSTKVDIYIK